MLCRRHRARSGALNDTDKLDHYFTKKKMNFDQYLSEDCSLCCNLVKVMNIFSNVAAQRKMSFVFVWGKCFLEYGSQHVSSDNKTGGGDLDCISFKVGHISSM